MITFETITMCEASLRTVSFKLIQGAEWAERNKDMVIMMKKIKLHGASAVTYVEGSDPFTHTFLIPANFPEDVCKEVTALQASIHHENQEQKEVQNQTLPTV